MTRLLSAPIPATAARIGPRPASVAAALVRLGEALARGGEPDAAREVLQQAATRADALDMPGLAADAGRLLDATVG